MMIALCLKASLPIIYSQSQMFYISQFQGERGAILPLTCLGYQQSLSMTLSAILVKTLAVFLLMILSVGSSVPSRAMKNSLPCFLICWCTIFTMFFILNGHFLFMLGVKYQESKQMPSYSSLLSISSNMLVNSFCFSQSLSTQIRTSPIIPLIATRGMILRSGLVSLSYWISYKSQNCLSRRMAEEEKFFQIQQKAGIKQLNFLMNFLEIDLPFGLLLMLPNQVFSHGKQIRELYPLKCFVSSNPKGSS